MALVHCDPFAHYTSAQYTDIYTAGGFGATVAMGARAAAGRPGLRFVATKHLAVVERLSLTTSGAVCIFQADLRTSAAPPSTNVLFAPLLGGRIQCSVDLNSDRPLAVPSAVWRQQDAARMRTPHPLRAVWIHTSIGAIFTIGDGTSGSIEVHISGKTATRRRESC